MSVTFVCGSAKHQRAQANVFQQFSAGVEDVHHVERFTFASDLADVLERFAGSHVGRNRHVVRGHVAAHALGRITQQLARFPQLFRRKLFEQLARNLRGHFAEKSRAIIGAHQVEHELGFGGRKRMDQFTLLRRRQIAEHFRGALASHQPKHDGSLLAEAGPSTFRRYRKRAWHST